MKLRQRSNLPCEVIWNTKLNCKRSDDVRGCVSVHAWEANPSAKTLDKRQTSRQHRERISKSGEREAQTPLTRKFCGAWRVYDRKRCNILSWELNLTKEPPISALSYSSLRLPFEPKLRFREVIWHANDYEAMQRDISIPNAYSLACLQLPSTRDAAIKICH